MAKPWAKKFYKSKSWQKCRASYIAKVHGLCERWLAKGQAVPGYIVHHKTYLTPSNINDPTVSLNHESLEYLCKKCHDEEHEFGAKKITREGLMFNGNGELIKHERL